MTGAVLVAAATVSEGSVNVFADVVLVLALCVAFGLVAQRLGQSVLVGYLLAGVVVGGQSSLDLVEDIGSFSFMGEVGIALLLFTVGLDLPLHKVRRFGTTALVAGGVQCMLTGLATAATAVALGIDGPGAFIIGAAVSMSSTAVVIRVLADRAEGDSVHGLVITGVLIAQDVLVVLVLLLIPILPGAEGAGAVGQIPEQLGLALAKLVGLILAIVAVERGVMRRIFLSRAMAGARELLAVASFTVSLGAIAACWALDLSPALGGFVAGIVMADAAYAPQVRSEIAPIRMGLMAIFFAYVGMLSDAGWMLENLGVVLLVAIPIVLGKGLLTWAAARLARVPRSAAILSAVALAQLGEFSFAVLTLGVGVGLVDADVFRLLVSVSLVTLLITPTMIGRASRLLQQRSLAAGVDASAPADTDVPTEPHAIVVGMGPAGRAVVGALVGASVPVVVIELNPRLDDNGIVDGEAALPSGQVRFVYGDASRPEILHRAGIERARLIVVTIPEPVAIRTIIAQSRQLAPELLVVARGRYHLFVEDLVGAGAHEVVDEEQLTGSELARVALQHLVLEGRVERRSGDRRVGDTDA